MAIRTFATLSAICASLFLFLSLFSWFQCNDTACMWWGVAGVLTMWICSRLGAEEN